MRTAAIALLLSLSVVGPALADHPRDRDWKRSDDVELDRSDVLRKLDEVERLLDAVSREQNKKRRADLARKAQGELADLRRMTREAPRVHREQPPPPAPPPAPPPVVVAPPPHPHRPPPPPKPVVYAIAQPNLVQLKMALTRESFPRDRLRVLESATPSHYFVVTQAQELLSLFEFPKDRLRAASLLKPRLLDPENHFRLYASFEFPADKAELKRILEN